MKKLLLLSSLFAVGAGALFSQAPSRLSYQAVVRNSSGVIVASGTNVSFRFTIHDGSSGGTILYQETTTQTVNNNFGQVAYLIGGGSVQQGSWPSTSQWASGSKFLQVEIDPAGGSSYTDLGAVQLVSVPFAQFANGANTATSATSLTGNINPSQINQSGASTGQFLQWNGSTWVPATVSGGSGGDITGVAAGTGLTGGGTSGDVTLNADNTNALWNANKIQGTSVSGAAPSNGQLLKYNGSTWAPADEYVNSAGTGLSVSGGVINSTWTISGSNVYNNNSGNIGIGTTSPSAKFSVAEKMKVDGSTGSITFTDQNSTIKFADPTSNNTPGQMYHYQSGTSNYDRWIMQHSPSWPTYGIMYSDSFDRYELRGGSSQYVVALWPAANSIGIGTRSPGYNLDIYNASSNAIINAKTGNASASSRLSLVNSSGASMDVLKAGPSSGSTMNGWSTSNMAILNNNSSGSMMLTSLDSIGFATNGSVAMRIKKTGEAMFNGTSTSSTAGYVYIAYPTYNSLKPALEINGTNSYMAFKDNSTFKGYIQQNGDIMNVASFGDLVLWSNGARQMYIKKTGLVGLGTSDPKGDFSVNGSAGKAAGIFTNSGNVASFSSGDTGTLSVYNNYTGSNYNYGLTINTKGSYAYGAYVNTKYCGLRIDAGGGSTNGYGGYMQAYNASTTNYAVYGGASGTSSTNYGVFGYAGGGTTNYAMYCSGNGVYTGTWSSSSDARLKKNVEDIHYGLSAVMKLRPASYQFRTDDSRYASMGLATGIHYGFIAQELEQVIPSVVSDNVHANPANPNEKVEYKAVNYTELIPVLTKAIQEQQAQIEQLKKEIELLKAKQ